MGEHAAAAEGKLAALVGALGQPALGWFVWRPDSGLTPSMREQARRCPPLCGASGGQCSAPTGGPSLDTTSPEPCATPVTSSAALQLPRARVEPLPKGCVRDSNIRLRKGQQQVKMALGLPTGMLRAV